MLGLAYTSPVGSGLNDMRDPAELISRMPLRWGDVVYRQRSSRYES